MMDANEFAKLLRLCADGERSIEDFEDWFDANSWNVHQQGDAELIAAVFEVEEIYSAYLDGRMSVEGVRRQMGRLADALRFFAPKGTLVEPDRVTVHEIGRREPSRAYSVSSGVYRQWNFSHTAVG